MTTVAPASPPTIAPIAPSASGPVQESSRLAALDVCRAVALLGIFFVNASMFGQPFGEVMNPGMPDGESYVGQSFYWFTMIFCAGKFYPLFSILFGVGLAIMVQSAAAAGKSFYLRFFLRLLMLAGFGIAHILLLWPGDVLLIYAGTGLWMLLLAKRSPRTLMIVAASVFSFGLICLLGMSALSALPPPAPEAAQPAMPEGATAFEKWTKVLTTNFQPPYDGRMMELEGTIMREGPFLHAMAVRGFNYAFSMTFVILVMFWQVLTCFCLGAALLKMGFLHGRLPAVQTAFILLGLLIGLPLNVGAALCAQSKSMLAQAAASVFMQVGGPLMSLMYLSLVMKWVHSGRAAGAARALARLGQMGLSGYILESVLMSAVMAHWGLAKFGLTNWAERGWLVIAIYAVILVLANLWMSVFRIGPLEWLWRTWTYLRLQPLRR